MPIGASAGGVTALQALFRLLPTDLDLAYVIILHLAPDHPSALAEVLSVCTRMPVFQVTDGLSLQRDCVCVIPPDRELVIHRRRQRHGASVLRAPGPPRAHRHVLPLDRDARIYLTQRKAGHTLPIMPQFAAPERLPPQDLAVVAPLRPEQAQLSIGMPVAALEQAPPPSVLVDDAHDILHLSPTAGRFILHSGEPVSNMPVAVVSPEPRFDLKFALTRAVEQRLQTLTHPIDVTQRRRRGRSARQRGTAARAARGRAAVRMARGRWGRVDMVEPAVE